jgi:hypothetical protein
MPLRIHGADPVDTVPSPKLGTSRSAGGAKRALSSIA